MYVDDGGGCAGFSPCFQTVQEGVDNASGEVFVFPGVYNESVDLTGMGSAAGGGMADLRVAGVDESGAVPSDDDFFGDALARITGANPISARPLFTGSLFISGFETVASTGPGVDVVASGDVGIHQSTAHDPPAGRDGIHAESTTGSVTAAFVYANGGSAGGDGVDVTAGEDAILTFVHASENSGAGAHGIRAEAGRDIRIEFPETQSNVGHGILASAGRNVELSNVDSAYNGGDGANVSAGMNITIFGSGLQYNGGSGLVAGAGNIITTDPVFGGAEELYANGGFGGDLSAPMINLDNVYAADSGNDGLRLQANNVTLHSITSGFNNGDGLHLEPLPGGVTEVQITESQYQQNADDGIELTGLAQQGDYRVNASAVCGNGSAGLNVQSPASVDAARDWWGDASGPTHPSSSGAGQPIKDSANGGAGTVAYAPWIDSGGLSPAAGAGNARVRLDAPLAVSLLAGGTPVFGDLLPGSGVPEAEPKPRLTTDNGSFLGAFGDVHTEYTRGSLSYTVAQHLGAAHVKWEWSCAPGLVLSTTVNAGEGLPWGDVNCDDRLDMSDVTGLLSQLADPGPPPAGCPAVSAFMGFYVFGNWDCDDTLVTPADVLMVLRHLGGVPAATPADCPAIGDTS